MKTSARVTLGGLVAFGAAATAGLAASPAGAATAHQAEGRTVTHAPAYGNAVVFVQTDNPAGNTIVAYHRAADGVLTQAGSYATGGLGGQLTGSVVDHTASQGSLAFDNASQLLYAVNAGSNTITVFAVHGASLTRVQTLSSGGVFPVSITFHDHQLYVLNARGGGSIQGYRRVGSRLIQVSAWHRDLGFDPAPTPEFTSTPGQIGFSPDGSKLIITTKGDGQSIEIFAVSQAKLAATPVVNADPGNVPFAFAFDQQRHLIVTEAGPSAVATFAINRDNTLRLITRTATGQAATCWVVSTGAKVYASNAGSADVSGYLNHDGRLASLGTTATDPGSVDAAASSNGHFLYVQTGGAGIVDEFRIGSNGALTEIGSVTVPGGVGGEGIAAS
jgi:6-phosphogluconolactonase (cycloisomerase 2 family)